MIAPPSTPLEQEIDLNWQEYPEGVGVFLTACENGTIKGNEPVDYGYQDCGCAYGHIRGLDEQQAWHLIYQRRQQFHSIDTGYTFLEDEVYPIQPGEDLTSPRVKKIYDLILARKPIEKGQE